MEVQPPAARPDGRIKRGATGALRGSNIYNTLTGQTVHGSATRGRTVTYYAPVQNDADFGEPLRVRGQASTTYSPSCTATPPGQHHRGDDQPDLHDPALSPGAHPIKIVVTVRNTAPLNASAARTLTPFSTVRPPIRDTVRFSTSRS